MGCAECHDHKFDPFTTKDFYSFAAFFADVQEEAVALPGPAFPVPDGGSGEAAGRAGSRDRRSPQHARHADARARRGAGRLGSRERRDELRIRRSLAPGTRSRRI